jgi:hypothetical protein
MAVIRDSLSSIYDINRDVYHERDAYEREMQLHRMKMEDSIRQQQMYVQQGFGHIQGGQALFGQMSQEQSQKPKHDPKDPLAFLTKANSKLLLTGEAL